MSLPEMPGYTLLKPLDHVQHGDEFGWAALQEQQRADGLEPEWYPCETFVGSRVERLTKRANLVFRRPV